MKSLVSLVLLSSLSLLSCSGIPPELIEAVTAAPAGELDEETVIAGLKEALRIGSGRTVERTAAIDGFLANELIRIRLDGDLERMGRVLRQIGLGRRVDELEVQMNRAAEQAAGEAREVLVDAVSSLGFEDAMGILRGHSTAATDYLRRETEEEMRARFHPIVVEKMEEVGLSRLYRELAQQYNRLPVQRPAIDLDDYVTDEALEGLFTVLGEEERKIREDPVARTTELLRRVFGAR